MLNRYLGEEQIEAELRRAGSTSYWMPNTTTPGGDGQAGLPLPSRRPRLREQRRRHRQPLKPSGPFLRSALGAGRGVRFHDLRHTCATLLLSRNVNPKIVSEMLGHATIAITLDTYSHVLPDMQEKAARAMEEALEV